MELSESLSQLKVWIERNLEEIGCDTEGRDACAWTPVAGDAGFRQYFRLNCTPSLLAVYAPPDTEDNEAFVRIAEFLRGNGIHVPKVLACDYKQGFLLIEDLGERLFFDSLNDESADMLYGEALMTLLRIQQCDKDRSIIPLYEVSRLEEEMSLFAEWFVEGLLDYKLNEEEQSLINSTITLALDSAIEQPQVPVHRDFHSRNIICCEDGGIGIIDFQGALLGPLTYDLVSLLRDCYIEWDDERVQRWVFAYTSLAIDIGIIKDVSSQQMLRWFDFMGLQRHIKVLGLFARLSMRDDKHGYLNDLPLVVKYVRTVVGRYDELSRFSQWFESTLIPEIKKQAWNKS